MSSLADCLSAYIPTDWVQWLKERVWGCSASPAPFALFERARDFTRASAEAPKLQQAMATVEQFVQRKHFSFAAPRDNHALHDRVTEIALLAREQPALQKVWGAFVFALHQKRVTYPDGRTLVLDFSSEIDLLKKKAQADIAIQYISGRLQDEEVEEIVAVEAESFSDGERWGPAGYAALKHSPDFRMLLARDAKTAKLLGYIGFFFEPVPIGDSPVLHIATVARRANAAKRGVATKLLTELFQKHCPKESPACLSVRDGNAAAKRLYENYGFKPAYYTKNVYPFPNERELRMWRESPAVLTK